MSRKGNTWQGDCLPEPRNPCRYARTDEIGVPYAITVDYQTVEDKTVTLRERDSMLQVRVPVADVAQVVRNLVDGETSWEEVYEQFPKQETKDE